MKMVLVLEGGVCRLFRDDDVAPDCVAVDFPDEVWEFIQKKVVSGKPGAKKMRAVIDTFLTKGHQLAIEQRAAQVRGWRRVNKLQSVK